MGLLPPQLAFPEPGAFLRFVSSDTQEVEYLRLMEREAPLVYPRRLSQTDPGGDSSTITLDELDPSVNKHHRYMAYIGVAWGALYTIWHPYSNKRLEWDESIERIDRELAAVITWEESPIEAPTFGVWIEPSGYPAVQARNTLSVVSHPAIRIQAAKYRVVEQADLPPGVVQSLRDGVVRSIPVSFGGGF